MTPRVRPVRENEKRQINHESKKARKRRNYKTKAKFRSNGFMQRTTHKEQPTPLLNSHWTDSKIRCHLFSCVVALTYLRRLELKLSAVGIKRTAEDVMDNIRYHIAAILAAHWIQFVASTSFEIPENQISAEFR